MIILDPLTGNTKEFSTNGTKNIIDFDWNLSGDWIVCGGSDGTIQIWNILTEEVHLLKESDGARIVSVDWDSNEERIAIGSSHGSIHVFDAKTELELNRINWLFGFIHSVLWKENGNQIAIGSTHGNSRIIDVTNGRLVSFNGVADSDDSVAYSPDKDRMAIIDGGI